MPQSICRGFVLIGLIFAILGCQEAAENPSSTPGTTPGATPDSRSFLEETEPLVFPGGDATSPESMAAKVNGVVITHGEVQAELQKLMMQYRGRVAPEQMATMTAGLERQALEKLVTKQLLIDAADRAEVVIEEKAIDEEFEKQAARFPSPEVFEEQLQMAGFTRDQFRYEIGCGLKIGKFLDEKLAGAKEVSDEAISEYYAQNTEQFRKPEEVKASHILIKMSPDDTEELKTEKRAKLAGIKEQVAGGADFAALAKEHSDCPSKESGGDLGFFARNTMVQPFSDAAFGMKVGELSDIVETQFGYHLITVTGRHDAGIVPLDDTKEEITNMLSRQKWQKALESYIETLMEEGELEYSERFAPIPAPGDAPMPGDAPKPGAAPEPIENPASGDADHEDE